MIIYVLGRNVQIADLIPMKQEIKLLIGFSGDFFLVEIDAVINGRPLRRNKLLKSIRKAFPV